MSDYQYYEFTAIDRLLTREQMSRLRALWPAVSRQSIEAWVRGLADSDKTKLMVRLVANDDPHHLHAELIQRVTQAIEPAAEQVPGGTGARRTVEELLGAAGRRAWSGTSTSYGSRSRHSSPPHGKPTGMRPSR
jgi:hypothetical protein